MSGFMFSNPTLLNHFSDSTCSRVVECHRPFVPFVPCFNVTSQRRCRCCPHASLRRASRGCEQAWRAFYVPPRRRFWKTVQKNGRCMFEARCEGVSTRFGRRIAANASKMHAPQTKILENGTAVRAFFFELRGCEHSIWATNHRTRPRKDTPTSCSVFQNLRLEKSSATSPLFWTISISNISTIFNHKCMLPKEDFGKQNSGSGASFRGTF